MEILRFFETELNFTALFNGYIIYKQELSKISRIFYFLFDITAGMAFPFI